MAKAKKRGPGQPTLYSPKMVEQILDLAREGFIESEICRRLKISQAALSEWKVKYPEFKESLKEAKRIVDDQVVAALFMKAKGFKHEGDYYPPDTTAQIFWLKNRQRKAWTDTQRKEITGKDGKPLADNGPIITVTLPANGYEAKEEDKK